MKRPGFASLDVAGVLPPSVSNQNVAVAIVVHVANTKSVVVLERPILIRVSWLADGMEDTSFRRLARLWDEIESHLSFWLRPNDDFSNSVAVQIFELRRFIARAGPDFELLPMRFVALAGILVPVIWISREANDNGIHKSVSIHVVSKVREAVAVPDTGDEFSRHSDFMKLPRRSVRVFFRTERRSFVPKVSGNHVRSTVAIHIGRGDSLRAETLIQSNSYPVGIISAESHD